MPNEGDGPDATTAGGAPGRPGGGAGAGPADLYWMGVGIRLGLEHPERARAMLAAIDAGTAPASAGAEGEGRAAETGGGAEVAAPAALLADEAARPPDGEVPVRSMLLARSATLPLATETATLFGWVERLVPSEITLMGRVIGEQVAEGATKDLVRGFALAWNGGVRLPNDELKELFGLFSWLEISLAGVLAGRDLRSEPKVKEAGGVGAIFQALLARSDPLSSEAAAILEREGEPARRGLIAVWNTWVAMHFRTRLPAPLFDQLVRAWTTVVGPLPPA